MKLTRGQFLAAVVGVPIAAAQKPAEEPFTMVADAVNIEEPDQFDAPEVAILQVQGEDGSWINVGQLHSVSLDTENSIVDFELRGNPFTHPLTSGWLTLSTCVASQSEWNFRFAGTKGEFSAMGRIESLRRILDGGIPMICCRLRIAPMTLSNMGYRLVDVTPPGQADRLEYRLAKL